MSAMSKFDEELVVPERVLNDMHYDMRQGMRLSTHRNFAFRFRHRWQICLQALKDRGDIPIQTKRGKVVFFFGKKCVFDKLFGTKTRPASESTILIELGYKSRKFGVACGPEIGVENPSQKN